MAKHIGKKSSAQDNFIGPNPVTGVSAVDVGTGRAYNDGAITVSWTAPVSGNTPTGYKVYEGASVVATIAYGTNTATITGLASASSHTYSVSSYDTYLDNNTNAVAASPVTATTVPQAPTVSAVDVGTGRAFNNGAATVTITAGATGGKAISNYGTTPSGLSETQNASSPITPTGMTSATAYTFTGRVYNANGWSAASTATAAVTITTVPDRPTGLTATNNGQNNNRASWTAPATGGKPISSYTVADNGGGAPDSVTGVTGTTYDFTAQTDNFGWYFNVIAINANGSSLVSVNSNQITTTPFSFVPFSFVPFGFTPFGFTPFGFTPFGFTPFGFTPFGFTPFGFTPFGFTPFGFSALCFKSLGATTMVQTTNGLAAAHDLVVGDVLISADIETMPTSFPGPQSEYPDWSVIDPSVNQTTTTITSIATRNADCIIVVNGETYSDSHYIFIKRDGSSRFVNVKDLLLTDLVYSTETHDWVEVLQVDVIPNVSYPVVCINTEPYDVFYTERFLVHDSYNLSLDNPVIGE
jgi:hypothetical protein